MITIDILQAEKDLSLLIQKVCDGEDVVITRDGKAVARLVRIVEATKRRVPGSMKGKFSVGPEFFDPLPEDELALWEGADPDPTGDKT